MKASDLRYDTSYRFGSKRKYMHQPIMKYDYKMHGILSKVSPAFLSRSNNKVLTALMRFIDAQFVTVLMCVERVQNFKNIFKQ